jgi:DNA-binding response OmpR family regulator
MASWANASEAGTMLFSDAKREDSPEIIQAGDFRINVETREVSVREHKLPLSNDEFELLVFLVGHPTSIITPHTRLSTRWGRTLVHQAEVFRVLSQLRKKLEAVGYSHYIRTEPWVVYRFDPNAHTDHR